MSPDEYDELLFMVRCAWEQHHKDVAKAADSERELEGLLRQLHAEDSRIAENARSRIAAAGMTLSTAGSE